MEEDIIYLVKGTLNVYINSVPEGVEVEEITNEEYNALCKKKKEEITNNE